MPNLNQVEDLKRILGYGARKNLWRIDFTLPGALGGAVVGGEMSILAKSAVLPGTRTLEVINLKYKGETFNLAGEKDQYEPNLKLAFDNPQNFAQRNMLELWVNIIQQDFTSVRSSPAIYKGSAIVMQLDNTLEPVRKFQFRGIFPKAVNHIELSSSDGALIETTVDFACDNFELIAL